MLVFFWHETYLFQQLNNDFNIILQIKEKKDFKLLLLLQNFFYFIRENIFTEAI